MYILALDTSNKFQISLLKNNVPVESISLDRSFFVEQKTNMSDVILQHISDILKKQNLKVQNINCIALINGAGYFTGLRISIVVAKILKLSLNIPIISLHSSYVQYKEVQPQLNKEELVVIGLDIGKSGCVLSVYDNKGIIITDTYVDEEELEDFFKSNSLPVDKLLIIGAKQNLFKEIEYFAKSKYCSNIVVSSLKVLGNEAFSLYNKGNFNNKVEPFYAKDVDMVIKKN